MPPGIMFFWFDHRINPTQEDAHIEREPFWFQFSLQLPQQHFYIITNKVEDISSPVKTKIYHSAKEAGGVSTIIGGGSHFFYALVRTRNRNNQPAGSAQNPPILPAGSSQNSPTPKISFLFKNGNNIKVGYFGILIFFNNHAAFAEVFGDIPKILDPNVIKSKDSTSTARSLYSFVEKWKLDMFIYMFREYYVRHTSIDNSLSVQDVWCQMS